MAHDHRGCILRGAAWAITHSVIHRGEPSERVPRSDPLTSHCHQLGSTIHPLVPSCFLLPLLSRPLSDFHTAASTVLLSCQAHQGGPNLPSPRASLHTTNNMPSPYGGLSGPTRPGPAPLCAELSSCCTPARLSTDPGLPTSWSLCLQSSPHLFSRTPSWRHWSHTIEHSNCLSLFAYVFCLPHRT